MSSTNYLYQQSSILRSTCNPQTEHCLAVSTKQGIIYVKNLGKQQGFACNPSAQNCVILGGTLPSQTAPTQNVGSVPVHVPYSQPNQDSGCDLSTQNCGQNMNQQQGRGFGTDNQQSFGQSNENRRHHILTDQIGVNQYGTGQFGTYGQNIGRADNNRQIDFGNGQHGQTSYSQIGYTASQTHNFGGTEDQIGKYGETSGTEYNQGYDSSSCNTNNCGTAANCGIQKCGNSRQISGDGTPRCPVDFQGLTKHPTDCKKFLNCANGQTYIQDCAPGTLFNPKLSICDFPYNVNCEAGSGDETQPGGYPWSQSSYGKYRTNIKKTM